MLAHVPASAPARELQARPDVGWRALWIELRDSAWIYALVPVLLTCLFMAMLASARAHWGVYLAFSACITGITGVGQSALYALVLGRLAPHATSGWAWPLRIVALATALFLGVDLTVRLFGALGMTNDTWAQRVQILRVGLVVTTAILAITVAFDRLHARRQEAESRQEALHRKVLQAQLTALQARTNPHFLFNALNTVASLIEEDPGAAERAVERLSDLFRYTLEGSSRRMVRLGDELRAVDDYLALERLRFGARLRVDRDIDARCEALRIPPLTLQPLVENAVQHGVASRREGGHIRIAAMLAPDAAPGELVLTVEDDGPGPAGSAHRAGSGTALADLRERLRLSYDDGAAVLEIGPGAAGGFRARVVLPRVEHEAGHARAAGEEPGA